MSKKFSNDLLTASLISNEILNESNNNNNNNNHANSNGKSTGPGIGSLINSAVPLKRSDFVQQSNICKICLTKFVDDDECEPFEINYCKCKFCKTCLREYIKQCIENFNVLPIYCPDPKCKLNGFLDTNEIELILLGDNYKKTSDHPTCSQTSVNNNNNNNNVLKNFDNNNNQIEIENNNNNNNNIIINTSLVCEHGANSNVDEYSESNSKVLHQSDANQNDQKLCYIDSEKIDEIFVLNNDTNSIANLNQQTNADNENSNLKYYNKYLKISENIEILRDPYRTYCPRPACENVCKVDRVLSDLTEFNKSIKVTCDKCKYEFCSNCFKKWITDLDQVPVTTSGYCKCYKKFLKKSDEISSTSTTSLLLNFDNIKRCPKCSTLIERSDGCAQIMCKACKHTFCFYCLTSLDNDFLLKHFTKDGPCRGKLGHSRISLFFHRIRVMIVFCATIIVIILSSPFILLLLPFFILSTRCRNFLYKFLEKYV